MKQLPLDKQNRLNYDHYFSPFNTFRKKALNLIEIEIKMNLINKRENIKQWTKMIKKNNANLIMHITFEVFL